MRWTIYIQHGKSPPIQSGSRLSKDSFTIDGSKVRWMSKSDMQDVGVTLCIRKLLVAVKDACLKEKESHNPRSTKRIKTKSK